MNRIVQQIRWWFRGVCQLRHSSLVKAFGALRQEEEWLSGIRRDNPGAKIERGVIVKGWRRGQLSLARESSVCRCTILSCGDPSLGHGRITVGEGTWIGQYNNFRTCPNSDIFIGRDCLISQFCTLASSNHGISRGETIKSQGMDKRRLGIVLEDDVWLGAGVTVLPGVTIGKGAVIAANSVVMDNIPPYEIWAGSPASRKGERT